MQEKVYILSNGRAVLRDFDNVDSQITEATFRSAVSKAETAEDLSEDEIRYLTPDHFYDREGFSFSVQKQAILRSTVWLFGITNFVRYHASSATIIHLVCAGTCYQMPAL